MLLNSSQKAMSTWRLNKDGGSNLLTGPWGKYLNTE